MRAHVQALKNAAVQCCYKSGVTLAQFMEDWGLEEVLTTAEADGWSRSELVAHFLCNCCVYQGKYNNFRVGLKTALKLLNDFGCNVQPHELSDLLAILNSGGSYEVVHRWVSSNYRHL
jgi:hypothetical protein